MPALKYWKQIAVLLAFIATFCAGMQVKAWQRDADELDMKNDLLAQIDVEVRRSFVLGEKLAETERQRNAYFKKLRKIETEVLSHPVYSGQCVDDDGRMLINQYLKGLIPSSGIDGTMSGTNTP